MAHKTLVNGTAYDMGGGVTLVSGTSYHIKNGKVLIGGTAYDISFVLPPAVLDLWSNSSSSGGFLSAIYCVTYANGYWVVGGKYSDSDNHYARIAYTTSLDGDWTIKDMWSGKGSSVTSNQINCITYANGYWVVGGQYYDTGSDRCARIAYATSLAGTWTMEDVWGSTSNNNTINCITYANSYWVIGGMYRSGTRYYARIAYTTNLIGTWTTKDIWNGSGSNNVINCIIYANSYWVVGGQYYSSKYYARVAYTTNLTGSWTTKDIWNSTSGSYINGITYANNYWVVGGRGYSSGYKGRIAYTTNLTGTWTTKDIWDSNSAIINCVTYDNNHWVVGGVYVDEATDITYARIAYTTNLSGTWTMNDVWEDAANIYGIIYSDSYWLAGGTRKNGTTYYARLAYAGSLDELGNTE